MQATAQRCVDGAISKTVQLDPEIRPTPTALLGWIQLARNLGCKGAAFYRRSETDAALRIDLRAACPSCAESRI